MSARTPGNPPPPDARALLIVVDAARRPTGSREDFVNAVASHPAARELDPQVVRRTAEAYADAVAGFRPPAPTAGYVAAAFWALRARVALWLGVPGLALVAIAVFGWGIPAWQTRLEIQDQAARLHSRMGSCRQLLQEVRDGLRSLEASFGQRGEPPPNHQRIRDGILEIDRSLALQESELAFCAAVPLENLKELRRTRTRVEETLRATEEQRVAAENLQSELNLAPTLRAMQEQLDQLLKKSEDLPMDEALRRRIRTAHGLGVVALQRSDDTRATECAAEIFGYLSQARKTAILPARLDELLESIRKLSVDPRVSLDAESIRAEAEGADLVKIQDVERRLIVMQGRLEEEYTLVISGGKWRFKNNNPSNKSYYVLVEAVTPDGRKLPRTIRNEEDRSSATVTIWGERVPFEVYERVRKDKQDDGVIQDNVFGRKQRGRMEEQVTILSDGGTPLPRAGQITRW